MPLQSIDPRNGSLVREYPEATEAEVQAALAAGVEAFTAWRRTSFEARASVLRRAAALLRERRDALARLMAVEMGKPVAQGRAEVEKCASVCDFYAERAAALPVARGGATEALAELRRLRAARRRARGDAVELPAAGRCSASRRRR